MLILEPRLDQQSGIHWKQLQVEVPRNVDTSSTVCGSVLTLIKRLGHVLRMHTICAARFKQMGESWHKLPLDMWICSAWLSAFSVFSFLLQHHVLLLHEHNRHHLQAAETVVDQLHTRVQHAVLFFVDLLHVCQSYVKLDVTQILVGRNHAAGCCDNTILISSWGDYEDRRWPCILISSWGDYEDCRWPCIFFNCNQV